MNPKKKKQFIKGERASKHTFMMYVGSFSSGESCHLQAGDQHLISPYNNTAELFIKIMRIKKMIANLRICDY